MRRREVLGTYLRAYWPYHWALLLSASLSVAQSLLLVLLALAIKSTFDQVLARSGFAMLVLPCAAILAVATCAAGLNVLARDRALRITKYVVRDMRMGLLEDAYVQLAFGGIEDRLSWHSAIVQDTERVDVGSNAVITVALPSVITAGIFLVAMVVLAPPLLFAALCAVPFAVLSQRFLGRTLQMLVTRFRQSFQAFDETILAALRRADLTRLRGAQAMEMARQAAPIDDLRRISGRMAWTSTAYSLAQGWIVTLVGVITLLIGGSAVATEQISLSSLAAYYFVLTQLGSSLNALWIALPQILAGFDSLDNIARLRQAGRAAPWSGARKPVLRGGIQIRKLTFSYGSDPLLREIDLVIAPGERVAIMGANGSGKSTLAHLILGLMPPQSGEILIDGVPLRELDLAAYRRQVGVMMQDNLLLAGSVLENIAYGRDDAGIDRVREAAMRAGADGFVQAMPGGYHAVPAGLSGGQSQMLGLARALVGRPPLLILDEPTNHLDRAVARALFDSLAGPDYCPTILLITHDRELAGRLDRCLTLDSGTLVATSHG
ncbi:MAG: ABC transporter ATP-binding protein [Nevskia sp.]|nr:ABC transporter ATP-binding protein [Nevskia sp.]